MKKVLAFSLMMMTLVVTGCATAPNTATHSGGGTDWISTVDGWSIAAIVAIVIYVLGWLIAIETLIGA